MNQNFKYLEDRFGGLNEKTVDCGTSGTGSGINAAIKDGYNSIIVKGICKENINWDSTKGERGYLKLKGYSNDQTSDKIVDNSSSSNSVISLTNSYLKIDNLTISGGTRGVHVVGNSLLWADNVTVESYTQRGISVSNNSVGWLGSVTVDGTKQSTIDERGIWFVNSDGYISGTTTVKGNSSSQGGINSSDNSRVWIDGTVNLDSNKQSLVVQQGGKMGFSSTAQITLTNSTDYGIKAYYGQMWNYGIINISDSSDGNGGILIDRSDAYLSNIIVTGGTGSNFLVGVYDSRLVLDGVTIKNHQGTLLDVNRSNLKIEGTSSITNESSSSGCMVRFTEVDFQIKGNTTINGTNNTDCNSFNMQRSRGYIENISISGSVANLYAENSDVGIDGGTFSSSGKEAISPRNGSRFQITSYKSNLSITSSADEALEIKSSYVKLDKGSNDFTISSTASGKADISSEEISTLVIEDHTFSNVEIEAGSSLILGDDATITTLTCSSTSNIEKNDGTVTNATGCTQAQ